VIEMSSSDAAVSRRSRSGGGGASVAALVVLGASVAVLAAVAAGCGGGSSGAGVAQLGTTTTGGGGSGASGGSGTGDPAAYAACMRENGVPDFPDPDSNGRFRLVGGKDASGRTFGLDTDSAAFERAQRACQKLLPGAPSSAPPPASTP
jgi:hypothetical protein